MGTQPPIFGSSLPQQTWAENWCAMPLFVAGELGPHLTQSCLGQGLPPYQVAFSANVYCGQTAGCIRISLGTEVGLSPGDIVLDGDPAPPKRGTAPIFRSVYCGQMAELLYKRLPKVNMESLHLQAAFFNCFNFSVAARENLFFDGESTKIRRLPRVHQNTCKTAHTKRDRSINAWMYVPYTVALSSR